jgi:hypothetical protein
MMDKKERLTYTITEQFPEGQATLILYAWLDDFGRVAYCYEHDQLNLGCGSFSEAIAIAQDYWEREKMELIERKYSLTSQDDDGIPF